MADMTAADVTVTMVRQLYSESRKNHHVKLQFGNGVLTYPDGGIPLPSYTAFGMTAVVETLYFYDEDSSQGVSPRYDSVNNKLRIWLPTQETETAGNRAGTEYLGGTTAIPVTTMYAEVTGW